MSASYPALTGEIETRRILKIMNSKKHITQEKRKELVNSYTKSISKLKFLWIILVDIILSAVYFITNIYLGIYFLTKDGPIKADTWIYGLWMLLIPWIPSLLMIPHEIYYRTVLLKNGNTVIMIIAGIILFPIIPSLLYLNQMRQNQDTTYMKRLDKLHHMKQILHSGLKVIILVFLAMRGYLITDNDTSCIIDNLGRSACFLSPLLISMILSMFILITSGLCLYLQDQPDQDWSNILSQIVRYLPYLVSILMFRIVSYAYIVNYIDYWTIIPGTGFILVNIGLQGYLTSNTEEEADDTIGDDVDAAPYAMIWDGNEWICRGLDDKDINLETRDIYKSDQKLQCISPILAGTLSTVVPFIQYNTPVKTIVYKSFIVNISILTVNTTIFCLVSYSGSFHYEPNILDNYMFNIVSLCIFCFGAVSPLLLLTTTDFCSSRILSINILSIVLLMVVTVFVPVTVRIAGNMRQISQLYFFTMKTSDTIIDIQTFSLELSTNLPDIELDIKYQYNNIQWDNLEPGVDQSEVKQIILGDQSSTNNTITKIILESEYNYRTSSPVYPAVQNVLFGKPAFNITLLQYAGKESGTIYVSRTKPNTEYIGRFLDCSMSETIGIDDISDNIKEDECTVEKLLNNENQIVERKCIKIDGKLNKLIIPCQNTQPEVKLVSRNKQLSKETLLFQNKLEEYFCCFNSSHLAFFHGQCSNVSLSQAIFQKSFKYIYQTIGCLMHKHKQFYSLQKAEENCIIELSFTANCLDVNRVYYDCITELYSCEKVIQKYSKLKSSGNM